MTFLTGMETDTSSIGYVRSSWFMTFLTGMETGQTTRHPTAWLVHDLPNRDGNAKLPNTKDLIRTVHDLPNRDGNALISAQSQQGWPVHDLPNRDGNAKVIRFLLDPANPFMTFLTGMETCNAHHNGYGWDFVHDLPNRDGN